jgi:hypothetical protein
MRKISSDFAEGIKREEMSSTCCDISFTPRMCVDKSGCQCNWGATIALGPDYTRARSNITFAIPSVLSAVLLQPPSTPNESSRVLRSMTDSPFCQRGCCTMVFTIPANCNPSANRPKQFSFDYYIAGAWRNTTQRKQYQRFILSS